MGLLKHFRSRSNLKKSGDARDHYNNEKPGALYPGVPNIPTQYVAASGRDLTASLPDNVITRIFAFVAPHTMDKRYVPCEDADIADDTCPLCDLRDLHHCAMTRRGWYRAAIQLL
jgi:hypothetical protein